MGLVGMRGGREGNRRKEVSFGSWEFMADELAGKRGVVGMIKVGNFGQSCVMNSCRGVWHGKMNGEER